jgi:hypothetical protein
MLGLGFAAGGALAQAVPAAHEEEAPAQTHELESEMGESEELTPDPSKMPPQPQKLIIELPDWMPERLRELELGHAPANLGGGLWPDELWPVVPVFPNGVAPQAIPGASHPPGAAGEPVPEALAGEYFGEIPAVELADPQLFLSGGRRMEIASFLKDCTTQPGALRARVVLFAGNQSLSGKQQPAELAARWFGAGEGVVAFCFFGHPERSMVAFSPAAMEKFGAESQQAIADAARKDAIAVDAPSDQLARFCLKLGLRLHRLALEPPPVQRSMSASAAAQAPATSGRKWLWLLFLGIGIGGLAAGGVFAWRRWRRPAPTGPWTFPPQEIIHRLGAPHSGGCSAAIKFR